MHGLRRQGEGFQLPWIVGEDFDSVFDHYDGIRVAEPTLLRDIQAGFHREHHPGLQLGVVAGIQERAFVITDPDRVAGVMLPVGL
jgi:hypothetical protein